jgi:hypothetical protein
VDKNTKDIKLDPIEIKLLRYMNRELSELNTNWINTLTEIAKKHGITELNDYLISQDLTTFRRKTPKKKEKGDK